MASLPGALFDEYSTLTSTEKAAAAAAVGDALFPHVTSGGLALFGGAGNNIFRINDGAASIEDEGGVDVVVSSASYTLGFGLEHLILTGSGNLVGRGNALNNVIAGNDGNNVLDGAAGHDALFGGAGNDVLEGGAGKDTLDGGSGNDTILGGADDDSLFGADGADSLKGGEGNDAISGGAGDDVIFGDAGSDTLAAGSGGDTLYGGTGADIFLFSSGDAGTATILDFVAGVDTIGVVAGTDIDAVLSTLSHDANGNAIVTLDGKVITLVGVHEDDVTAGFFHIV